jgi:DNA-binding beta-propeller fold protein YncE
MAGSGEGGYRDGIGSNARFRCPGGVVCTSDGSKVVVADTYNHRLRLIHTATNQVTTIAGNGKVVPSDGQALAASIDHPLHLTFDRTTTPESVLYITGGHAVAFLLRRFDLTSGPLS